MDSVQDERWEQGFRRELRHELRDELTETHRDRDDITIPGQLNKKLDKSNSLYEKVVSSREAVIDSEHIRLLSEIACHQSRASRGELIKFDPIKYREKLITYMEGRGTHDNKHIEWFKLGERAIKCFKIAPSFEFSYGALETIPIRQISRAAGVSSKKLTSSIVKPKQIQNVQQHEEESTTKDVQHILSHLKTVCRQTASGMEYHRFLVDPNNFSRTVENIFHFSFLIKEGRAGIRKGENGLPYVFIPDNVDDAGQSTNVNNYQTIVSVDMQKWKEWIEVHEINESYITIRET